MAQTITVPTVEEHDALAHDVSGLRRDVLEQGGTVQALTSRVAALEAAVAVWHPTPAPVPDPDPPDPPTNPDPPVGAHAYFEALLDHPHLLADYSLRDQGQLNDVSNQPGTSGTVIDDPAHDTYAWPQDAARIVIPPGAGSLRPFPLLPIHVETGSVLIVWDHWWGPEYLNPMPTGDKYNHKQFVVLHGSNNDRWAELRAHFIRPSLPAGMVAEIDLRAYGQLTDTIEVIENGTPTTRPKYEMTSHGVIPREGGVNVYVAPQTWVRYFALCEDIGTLTPKFSLWLADETRDPIRVYQRVTIARTSPLRVDFLRCQYNASQGRVADAPALVAYLRNVLVFRDLAYADVEGDPALLVRPTAEG